MSSRMFVIAGMLLFCCSAAAGPLIVANKDPREHEIALKCKGVSTTRTLAPNSSCSGCGVGGNVFPCAITVKSSGSTLSVSGGISLQINGGKIAPQ